MVLYALAFGKHIEGNVAACRAVGTFTYICFVVCFFSHFAVVRCWLFYVDGCLPCLFQEHLGQQPWAPLHAGPPPQPPGQGPPMMSASPTLMPPGPPLGAGVTSPPVRLPGPGGSMPRTSPTRMPGTVRNQPVRLPQHAQQEYEEYMQCRLRMAQQQQPGPRSTTTVVSGVSLGSYLPPNIAAYMSGPYGIVAASTRGCRFKCNDALLTLIMSFYLHGMRPELKAKICKSHSA